MVDNSTRKKKEKDRGKDRGNRSPEDREEVLGLVGGVRDCGAGGLCFGLGFTQIPSKTQVP